jgi:predicted enzyme related to lactoylglutathione lyase
MLGAMSRDCWLALFIVPEGPKWGDKSVENRCRRTPNILVNTVFIETPLCIESRLHKEGHTMTTVTSHEPGSFCWVELATSDAAAARSFYTQLFGWGVREFPMGEDETYYIFTLEDRDAGAMYQIGPRQQGMPPNWASYVAVTNADDSAEKAKSLGATLMMPPFDVFDMGRMTFLSDPQGAMLAIWQAKTHYGIGIRDQPRSLCWNELQARDLGKAKQFYTALFGWRLKESPEYNEIYIGERPIGGIMESKAPPGVPSFWMPYFAVEDCDASFARAQSLGGMAYVPPTDIPNAGRFAVLADPQGASFAIIQLTM